MWTAFSCDGSEYFIQLENNSESLLVYLTNMILLWKEEISLSVIKERYQDMNPEKPPIKNTKILEVIINEFTRDTSNIIYDIKIQSELVELDVKRKTSDGTVSFRHSLNKCSPDEFYRRITLPMMLVNKELQERQNKLKKLLGAKDTEITEYKLEGGKLFRGYVKTEPFDDTKFIISCKEECIANMPLYSQNLGSLFSSEINDLYTTALQVSANENSKEQTKTVEEKKGESTETSPKKEIKKWQLPSQPNKRFKRNNAKVKL